MIPPRDPDTGLLPAGRYIANIDEVHKAFVTAEEFASSQSRATLWKEWTTHVDILGALLGSPPRTWMAGSFVTAKLDPSDVDVFYGFDPDAFDGLEDDDLRYVDLLCRRESCLGQFQLRVDAYFTRLPDQLPFDDLRPRRMGDRNLQAFQALGLYDEIWQRTRHIPPGGRASAAKQGLNRRGYLEVQL